MKDIIFYENIDNKENEIIISNVNWGRKSNKNFSKLHGLSSYLAMFCPSLPKFFIDKYSNENDLIMDNFSGRGTTALVCREMNRKFIGNDLNPYAYVLTRLKISCIQKNDLLNKLNELKKEFETSKYKNMILNNTYNELKIFYSNKTLRQLIFLRNFLGKNWFKISEIENAILVFCLSIMHGPTRKNNETIYLSLDMPNAISMSPNYVKNYSIKNKLSSPKVDVFEQIKNRIETKFDDILTKEFDGTILFDDATEKNDKIENNSVSLVITSPPYLNIVNYTTSNWIKLWLLGYERMKINKEIKLSDNYKFDQYVEFIKKYLDNIWIKLKNDAHICLVIGDVFDNTLIENVWSKIKDNVKYELIGIYYDYKYLQSHKITNMLNNKSGKATKIEKVLVLRKKYE